MLWKREKTYRELLNEAEKEIDKYVSKNIKYIDKHLKKELRKGNTHIYIDVAMKYDNLSHSSRSDVYTKVLYHFGNKDEWKLWQTKNKYKVFSLEVTTEGHYLEYIG